MFREDESLVSRRCASRPALLIALHLLLGASLSTAHAMPSRPEPNPGHCSEKRSKVTPATLEALSSQGPYGFATRDFVFIDTSRPTAPNRDYPGSPVRTLPTRVWYPVCPQDTAASPPPGARIPVASGGPFPLLAYAHGLTSLGDTARHVTEHLTTHGYIVIEPLFPLSHRNAPGGPTFEDTANQPEDLAFAMRQVAMLSGADADLAAAVDTQRRGILGFSGGGMTVLIATYHPLLALEGIQSAVAQAPAVACALGPPFYARPLPMLIISGTSDELVPITDPEKAFSLAPPPVTLVELLGGTHSGFMNREVPFVNNTDTRLCQDLLDSGATSGGIQQSRFADDLLRDVDPGVLEQGDCSDLCSQSFTQTMGATRQLRLIRAATLAHFEATLRKHFDAAWFLQQQLEQQPDVDVFIKK
jgi:dienelactone hydrolase